MTLLLYERKEKQKESKKYVRREKRKRDHVESARFKLLF